MAFLPTLRTWLCAHRKIRSRSEHALWIPPSPDNGAAHMVIGRLQRSEAVPEALRALSQLLEARALAVQASVIWLDASQQRTGVRCVMSFSREKNVLCVEWDDGSTHSITIDESGVHDFAATNKFGL